MKTYIINNINYEIVKNYKNGFDYEEVKQKCEQTDYFDSYDYIFGDYSYGKLRLKGFCDKGNKIFKDINDIEKVDEYIKNICAYECKYFIIKKIK